MDVRFLDNLKQSLEYNPETGKFHWKAVRSRRIKIGDIAGTVDSSTGYHRIAFEGKKYKSHRLAWLFTYGKWPEGVIDHVDGNKLNNRIENLRDVDQSVNMQNQRKVQVSNKTSCHLGVSFYEARGKFIAQIQLGGKQKHLGYFLTQEEASAAYLAAKRELHEGCTI